ncbi:hypothetical protein COCMIDRAFT_34814 [Bipolaris oryzae ATCC 44560]|uniref:Uncharacterized protein n=1 Tax=Bipolaris oryzae ATCC 44560 TaxID=930090 RepID=W6ZJY3_COCMI|nr:uncharacterized protein COCMIDRAFT_34814 [Bipolaris oryzae ATCC 44560]EUC47749.1 hypothetical protein COCMIDRAFT_34814 [Bipolaris oryzae ATCC 44560]
MAALKQTRDCQCRATRIAILPDRFGLLFAVGCAAGCLRGQCRSHRQKIASSQSVVIMNLSSSWASKPTTAWPEISIVL